MHDVASSFVDTSSDIMLIIMRIMLTLEQLVNMTRTIEALTKFMPETNAQITLHISGENQVMVLIFNKLYISRKSFPS